MRDDRMVPELGPAFPAFAKALQRAKRQCLQQGNATGGSAVPLHIKVSFLAFYSSMISPENRSPLFGIMLLTRHPHA